MPDQDKKRFSKSFTQQEPIAEEAIARAVEIMRSGRLHRYNVNVDEAGETALLEKEFASYLGAKYCLACASCGMAMYLALKSAGVKPGDKVLCNAFTLAPVPGAIDNAGAETVLVEITESFTIDLNDLREKAADPAVKWLLLSHMRGHLADMERVTAICRENEVTLIEDCAHTMGASWNGKKSGTFGRVACFSTQTYKHMNSGEGGLLTTDDPALIARAIIYSGSYMLFERHLSRPDLAAFAPIKTTTPNYSCRMDNLRAALLRFQLPILDQNCRRWNDRYRILERELNTIPGLRCPVRPAEEYYVGSSIQFSIHGQDTATIRRFLTEAAARGVELKWFGATEPVGFTSSYTSWHYLARTPDLKATSAILATMCDMRVPLTLSLDDCRDLAQILREVAKDIFRPDYPGTGCDTCLRSDINDPGGGGKASHGS